MSYIPHTFAGSTELGSTEWREYDPERPHLGVTTVIDISHCKFARTPIIVTSIHGYGYHWELTGTSAVYNATPTSFKVCVKFPTHERGIECRLSPEFANLKEWRVQWIAVGDVRTDAEAEGS